jgi:hypothetical protein
MILVEQMLIVQAGGEAHPIIGPMFNHREQSRRIRLHLHVCEFILPRELATETYHSLDELLYTNGPLPHPLRLSSDCEGTVGALPFKCSDLIGSHAL